MSATGTWDPSRPTSAWRGQGHSQVQGYRDSLMCELTRGRDLCPLVSSARYLHAFGDKSIH